MKKKDTFNWTAHQDQVFDFGQEVKTDIPLFASEPSEDLFKDTTMTYDEVSMYLFLLGWADKNKGLWEMNEDFGMATFTKEFDNINIFSDGRAIARQIIYGGVGTLTKLKEKKFYTWRQLIEYLIICAC